MEETQNEILNKDIMSLIPYYRSKPCTCMHCGKVCKNKKALDAHSRGCKERKLTRYFVWNQYIFLTLGNQNSKFISGMSQLMKEAVDAKCLIWAMQYAQHRGDILAFGVMEHHDWIKELPHLENGNVHYNDLKKYLSVQDFEQLKAERSGIQKEEYERSKK